MNWRGSASKVYLLCGIVFSIVGAASLAVAFFTASHMEEVRLHGRGNVELFPIVFGAIGGIMLVLGVVLLAVCWRRGRTKRRLLAQGTYITAEVTGFPADYSVMVNGWPSYRIECSYRDPRTQTVHVFYSEPLRVDPVRRVTGQTARVYVDKDSDYQDYFVDVGPLLPRIKRH